MNIQQLLELTIEKDASDLHLAVGFMPMVRIHSNLLPVLGTEKITPNEMLDLILPILTPIQKKTFETTFELDFSFEMSGKARFRVNIYKQKGYPAAAIRLIPYKIRTMEELGFSKQVEKITTLKQGFVLVTGPTGHGKSTALASFINQINLTRSEHILTIEDPIEYVFPYAHSLINQRELGNDTLSWGAALKSALREDPDVVLVGEMRDLETMASAMTIAETGHLVFATLHTNSASQSVDRIIDVFPENQQPQIRLQLAATLEAVISLRLIPTISPGRILAYEVMFATDAVRNVIREGKTYLIDNIIETSGEMGMISMERSLANLVRTGKIAVDTAQDFARRPELMAKLLK